jgi:hypothetical protein
MGSVSSPTFFADRMGFYVTYNPGLNERYHIATPQEVFTNGTAPQDLAADYIDHDEPNRKVTFTFSFQLEQGHRYRAKINFSYPVTGQDGTATYQTRLAERSARTKTVISKAGSAKKAKTGAKKKGKAAVKKKPRKK